MCETEACHPVAKRSHAVCEYRGWLSGAIWVHGGPRWACLLCNLIYIHFSVSKMEAVLLTQATEEQRNPHKEQSYLASRSEHHWRWCVGLFNVGERERESESESESERERARESESESERERERGGERESKRGRARERERERLARPALGCSGLLGGSCFLSELFRAHITAP